MSSDPPQIDRPPITSVLSPRAAYNLVAPQYDRWEWQKFWRLNEAPVVLDLLGALSRTRNIVDLGSGTGFYMGLLAHPHRTIVGVDVAENMLSVAREHLGPSAHLVQADVTELPLRPRWFDLALSTRVLSHVADISAFFAGVSLVLKRGGYLLITDVDPSHNYRFTRFPIGHSSVYVDTFKWSLRQIAASAKDAGSFELRRVRRITAQNVRWMPSEHELPAFDRTGKRAAGYVALLKKSL